MQNFARIIYINATHTGKLGRGSTIMKYYGARPHSAPGFSGSAHGTIASNFTISFGSRVVKKVWGQTLRDTHFARLLLQ